MDASQDIVVAISPEREKFFGRSGTMLIPSPETVAAFIQELPTNKLITTELLRQELAMRHQADVTCPAAMLWPSAWPVPQLQRPVSPP